MNIMAAFFDEIVYLCGSTDYLLTECLYSLRAKVWTEIIVASLRFKHERMLLLQRVRRVSRLKEESSCS